MFPFMRLVVFTENIIKLKKDNRKILYFISEMFKLLVHCNQVDFQLKAFYILCVCQGRFGTVVI